MFSVVTFAVCIAVACLHDVVALVLILPCSIGCQPSDSDTPAATSAPATVAVTSGVSDTAAATSASATGGATSAVTAKTSPKKKKAVKKCRRNCKECVLCYTPTPSYPAGTQLKDLDYIQKRDFLSRSGRKREYTGKANAIAHCSIRHAIGAADRGHFKVCIAVVCIGICAQYRV